MRISNFIISVCILVISCLLASCDFKLKPFDEEEVDTLKIAIMRYDRMESLYLTTGDFSALQQMSTEFPNETRTLIEKVLGLGSVDEPDINNKLLRFFQDSTLQTIISDAEVQYANMEDLNKQLTDAFHKLKTWCPNIKVPLAYAQISSLDQSIVVGDESVGICLDKYLGADYPLYKKYYDEEQRKTMTREYIVPDFLGFYLLSIYPLHNFRDATPTELDLHLGKIQWVVNKTMGQRFFKTRFINIVDKYMQSHPGEKIEDLLSNRDVKRFDKYR